MCCLSLRRCPAWLVSRELWMFWQRLGKSRGVGAMTVFVNSGDEALCTVWLKVRGHIEKRHFQWQTSKMTFLLFNCFNAYYLVNSCRAKCYSQVMSLKIIFFGLFIGIMFIWLTYITNGPHLVLQTMVPCFEKMCGLHFGFHVGHRSPMFYRYRQTMWHTWSSTPLGHRKMVQISDTRCESLVSTVFPDFIDNSLT